MTEQESEVGQSGSDGAWEATGPFSSNGSDSGGPAVATEGPMGAELDDRAKFLADLARVMQTTAAAEQARNAEGTEQRRQSHIDSIRAREALEAEELRELAKKDVKGSTPGPRARSSASSSNGSGPSHHDASSSRPGSRNIGLS